MIWMAVTADEYELPIAVSSTSSGLAKKMNAKSCSIRSRESRYRRGILKCKQNTRIPVYGEYYRVVKVDDTEEDADERDNHPSE